MARMIDTLRQAFCYHAFSAINANCKHLEGDYYAIWQTCVKCGKKFMFTFRCPDAFKVVNSPKEEAEFNVIAEGKRRGKDALD